MDELFCFRVSLIEERATTTILRRPLMAARSAAEAEERALHLFPWSSIRKPTVYEHERFNPHPPGGLHDRTAVATVPGATRAEA